MRGTGIPLDEKGLDSVMLALACILVYGSENDGHYNDLEVASKNAHGVDGVYYLARFLDDRMCVPRDMGMMSADAIKRLALLGK